MVTRIVREPRLIIWVKIVLAIVAACISAYVSYQQLSQRGFLASDFMWPLRAAQHLLAGQNPYEFMRPDGPYPFDAPFYYPLTAALVATPFTRFPPYLAGALFFGVSAGILMYAILRSDAQRWPIFLSAPFFIAASVAQWSPLIAAAALLPALQGLATCKPNLGIAAFLYRPTVRGAIVASVFLGVALLVLPTWPHDWFRNVQESPRYIQPFQIAPFGALLLLAVLRWRSPQGRLLVWLSIAPQLLWFYDQLLLWLIPRSWVTGLLYSALSWVAYTLWLWQSQGMAMGPSVEAAMPYVLGLLYFPALLMVLWPRRRSFAYALSRCFSLQRLRTMRDDAPLLQQDRAC